MSPAEQLATLTKDELVLAVEKLLAQVATLKENLRHVTVSRNRLEVEVFALKCAVKDYPERVENQRRELAKLHAKLAEVTARAVTP